MFRQTVLTASARFMVKQATAGDRPLIAYGCQFAMQLQLRWGPKTGFTDSRVFLDTGAQQGLSVFDHSYRQAVTLASGCTDQCVVHRYFCRHERPSRCTPGGDWSIHCKTKSNCSSVADLPQSHEEGVVGCPNGGHIVLLGLRSLARLLPRQRHCADSQSGLRLQGS